MRIWLITGLALAMAGAVSRPAVAQAVPSAPALSAQSARAIDAIARDEIRSGSSPGIAVGIVQDGLLVYARAFGVATVQRRRPAQPSTEFYVGQISEQFTAASILLLAQSKVLTLGDKVTRYVPELTVGRDVTIQQLLNQTSGLPDYAATPAWAAQRFRPVRLGDVIAAVNRMAPASAPGKKFAQNPLNYMILGAIVQRASGLPLSVYYQTHIFAPLIMTSTFAAGDEGISASHAAGYAREGRQFVAVRVPDPSWLSGWGSLVTNVHDLAKWDIGMPLVLNVDSVRSMWTAAGAPGELAYGMGWTIDQRGGQRYVWQNGTIAGYHAMNAVLPDQHVAVIVLANVDSSGDPALEPERIAARILDIVAPMPPSRFGNVIVERAREWLGRLQRLDIDRTQLTPAFSKYLSDQVVQYADFKALGTLLSMVPLESFTRSGDTVYVFDVRFTHGEYHYEFALAPDGKIDGLFLRS